MAALSVVLADTSAWARAGHPTVAEQWEAALRDDRIAVCDPVRLELLYSTRSATDYAARAEELDALHQLECGTAAFRRALQVQRALGERGGLHHRSVKLVDLLVAAAGELAGVAVWHYDEDFDRIAAVTGQATEWLARRGSL